jgi:hypothetical protein
MDESNETQKNLVDTTDCLEAVGVCRGWKTFLFVIMAICLLLLQISFWLVNTGFVKAESEETAFSGNIFAFGGTVFPPLTSKEYVVSAEQGGTRQPLGEPDTISKAAEKAVAEEPNGSEEAPQSRRIHLSFDLKMKHLNLVIRSCNFVLIFAATLYCLTMLFCFKVSLMGRLGGLNHICRAFFISLVMVIFLLPWQNFFGNVVVGAIYGPEELVKWCTAGSKDIFNMVILYLRFTGYWLLIVLLLIFSQLRSSRWSKAVLRRLEIL